MLNAKCYDLHMITERLLAWVPMQKKAWSVPYHSYIHTLVLTQQSSGAGLPRKAWVDSPGGMWAPLPEVPSCSATTPADIKGLFLFLYVTPIPFLLSQEGEIEKQNATSQKLTLCYRSVVLCISAKNSFWKNKRKNKQTQASSADSKKCLLET